MKIYGLEKLSMVDYEGHLCCVVFTAGCNFRCPFCQNSDLVECKNLNQISEQEFFNFLLKRKGLLDAVCVSGGEPTLQPDLPQFLQKIKQMGYLIKLDTNGCSPKLLQQLIKQKLVDYVAMDIKNSQTDYYKTAGCNSINLADIDACVQLLKQNKVDYEFRTTLVDEHHTLKQIEEMANWLKGAKKLYLQCFVDSGSCLKSGLKKVPKPQAEQFKQILSKTVTDVYLRGY